MNEYPPIEGAQDVVKWFGYWPTFHDAEVVSILLSRSGRSEVRVHAWEITRDVDATGHFVCTRHAVVTFELEGHVSEEIGSMRLESFNHQNVQSSIAVRPVSGGYELILDGIFGVAGSLFCEKLSVTLQPGIPPGRIDEHAVRHL